MNKKCKAIFCCYYKTKFTANTAQADRIFVRRYLSNDPYIFGVAVGLGAQIIKVRQKAEAEIKIIGD